MTPLSTKIEEIRGKFAHIDHCPLAGARIFFENAGGTLTLQSVVDTSTIYAGIPDNQGRANPTSVALGKVIEQSRADAKIFFNIQNGQIIFGESGTELLFRLIRTAALSVSNNKSAIILGSTLEHPASRSAAQHWAQSLGIGHNLINHDPQSGLVTSEDYARHISPDCQIATIIHTSPVTGISLDISAIAQAIRSAAPECFILVDGIQHASHGHIDLSTSGVDGYVISPYKVFSRHGYAIAWVSDRLSELSLEQLAGGPDQQWELGTRDNGAYATFSDVVRYFEWLGTICGGQGSQQQLIEHARESIKAHEKSLCSAMIEGINNQPGLASIPDIDILGGKNNSAREGLVCFSLPQISSSQIVDFLNQQGIRTHIRKADHYSGNILNPLGLQDAVRVSLAHYNSYEEIARFLEIMHTLFNRFK